MVVFVLYLFFCRGAGFSGEHCDIVFFSGTDSSGVILGSSVLLEDWTLLRICDIPGRFLLGGLIFLVFFFIQFSARGMDSPVNLVLPPVSAGGLMFSMHSRSLRVVDCLVNF